MRIARMNSVVVVIVAALMLVGCAGTAVRNSPTMTPAPQKNNIVPPGFVPVHIANPDLLSQEVCLFEGATTVQVIPDARRGGWMYSRPAFVCYRVSGAHSENSWHEYAEIYLPRNFDFVVASRIIGIFGNKGRPNIQFYRTGGDPYAITYTSIAPRQPQMDCGALVQLQRQPSSVRPLNVEIDIDLRPLGAAIANGLTNAVYGR